MIRSTLTILIACLLCQAGPAFAQVTYNGSTGAQGAFPPAAIAGLSGYNTLSLNLATGGVTATNNATTVGTTVTLPGAAVSGDAFPTGDLDFTTFTVPTGVTLKFLPNATNTPVTIRTTGDVNIIGTIDLKGGNGTAGTSQSPTGNAVVGKGNVGGADGGTGGVATFFGATTGGAGSGRGGGGSSSGNGHGLGGSFPYSNNPTLIPLIGGSGGGGTYGYAGANGSTGGGGGGAILIASSTKIAVTGTIDATGGAGGSNSYFGGGGSGGGIRLMSNRIEISGTLKANGGAGGAYNGGSGLIRVEASDFSITGTGSSTPIASYVLTPGVVKPVNLPALRISSIAGVDVPSTPAGAVGNIDVTVPVGTGKAIVMTGSNIPDATTITIALKGNNVNTTQTGTMNNNTVSVTMTLPSIVFYLQAYSNEFTISAELQQQLPLLNGEKIMKAAVEFDGERSQTYFYTASGQRVSAEALLGSK